MLDRVGVFANGVPLFVLFINHRSSLADLRSLSDRVNRLALEKTTRERETKTPSAYDHSAFIRRSDEDVTVSSEGTTAGAASTGL